MSQWGYRVCSGCNNDLEKSEYSRNQWRKAAGVSRCSQCVSECVQRDSGGFETARCNNATRVSVTDFSYHHASGSFRHCQYGRYTGGQRTGQRCVVKWFKSHNQSFESDMEAVEKTLHILTQFNQGGFLGGDVVRINFPEEWNIRGTRCFVEPFIDNFFKMNSNSGWTSSSHMEEVDMLQALSHYSYHVSSGQFVLCDLQGGVFRDGIVLTDPVILSRSRRFGPTDLGAKGISNFFYYHHCTRYCRRSWTQPRKPVQYFRIKEGTSASFEAIRNDRPVFSGRAGFLENVAEESEEESEERNYGYYDDSSDY